jgi:prephenate dehydratase
MIKKIYYLGPKYSYHYLAGEKYLDQNKQKKYELISCKSFDEIFERVSISNDLGIIAAKNLVSGNIYQHTEKVISNGLKILSVIRLPIKHCILAKQKYDYNEVEIAFLHHQIKLQCSKFLENKKWEIIEVFSTSEGAKMVCEDKKLKCVTIGGEILARVNDLVVMEENIGNSKNNYTDFILVQKNILEN